MLMKLADLSQSDGWNWVIWQAKDPCPRLNWSAWYICNQSTFNLAYGEMLIYSAKSVLKKDRLFQCWPVSMIYNYNVQLILLREIKLACIHSLAKIASKLILCMFLLNTVKQCIQGYETGALCKPLHAWIMTTVFYRAVLSNVPSVLAVLAGPQTWSSLWLLILYHPTGTRSLTSAVFTTKLHLFSTSSLWLDCNHKGWPVGDIQKRPSKFELFRCTSNVNSFEQHHYYHVWNEQDGLWSRKLGKRTTNWFHFNDGSSSNIIKTLSLFVFQRVHATISVISWTISTIVRFLL